MGSFQDVMREYLLKRTNGPDSRYPINPAELDTPPDAIAVIFEDAKLLQKFQIFRV
jgi:hypothetical protein